jgi:enoyl-CoA hydratase/carnithine racemase
MEYEAQAIAAMAGSADFQEGVMAFLQKRKPEFGGK